MDEFETDEENLEAWMKHFNRDMPQFCTQVSSPGSILASQ
jgi:hypothetical protein